MCDVLARKQRLATVQDFILIEAGLLALSNTERTYRMAPYPIPGGNETYRGRPQKIMRHNVLEAYPGDLLNGVPGVEMYGARVLASSYPGDVIMMPSKLSDRRLLDSIIEHYRRVGLEVANQFIFNEDWSNVRQFPELEVDAFHFGAAAHAVAPNEAFARMADELNDKNKFIDFCRLMGVPTPGTILFASGEEFQTYKGELPGKGFPVYVKAAVSASGMHVIRCEDQDELFAAVAKMPGAFQVQEGLPLETKFYNIQYTEVGGVRNHGALTLQKLNGNEHNGNIFPTSDQIVDAIQPLADKLAEAMFDRGMRSTWAYDVAITPAGEVMFIEANPRWNGASYYSHPAERLKAKAWEGQYVQPRHTNFDFLFRNAGDWEYNVSHGSGIVIINWATVVAHKLGLLVIGTPEQRESLLSTFRNRYC